LGVIRFEDLRDLILIGHSYGGMVATHVAAAVPERVRQLVYLDAFAPRSGQSLFDLVDPAMGARQEQAAMAEGEGWQVPPNPLPADTPAEDFGWLMERRAPHPL